MRYTVRPISDRSTFTGKHRRSPFRATWTGTETLLLHEVRELRGRYLVIECDVSERDIRIDGGLYARARPVTPAVRVAFESQHGSLVYATDRFNYWQDNVRAIALGLEALRKVDRYAITKRGEQYVGFRALPAGTGGNNEMSYDDAAATLELVAIGDDRDKANITIAKIIADPAFARDVWREARRMSHPDVNDGDHTMWHEVEQAARVLGLDGA